MSVPAGASAGQVERMRTALRDEETQRGMRWLVVQDLIDSPLMDGFKEHFMQNVLIAEYGLEPEHAESILDFYGRQYRRELRTGPDVPEHRWAGSD